MTALHARSSQSSSTDVTTSAIGRLRTLLREREEATAPVEDFARFEEELHELLAAAESELLGRELERLDPELDLVVIEGTVYRRVLTSAANYLTRGGVVRVERGLYRAGRGERTVVPMELRAGVVEGFWTPGAAMLAVWAVAHMTTKEAAELFERSGGMQPSSSSLDRLPKQLGGRWEEQREVWEEALRLSDDPIPESAVAVGVSLDGVMVPMKDGQRREKRYESRRQGKLPSGPAGYREAACGTVSLYDAAGDRVGTRYLGRMPESGQTTLKSMLEAELDAVLIERPDLRLVAVADGAKDNWTWFGTLLDGLDATQVVDFYHAVEHLHRAMDAAYGAGCPTGAAQFDKYRRLLRDDDSGVDKVIDHLRYQLRRHLRSKKLKTELGYFRNHRRRMQYAKVAAQNLPIGSGVVEAANKTLVVVRMKRAGARWRHAGGQAVLTFRALCKTGRFDRAWNLLSAAYQSEIDVPDNVIPLCRQYRSSAVSG